MGRRPEKADALSHDLRGIVVCNGAGGADGYRTDGTGVCFSTAIIGRGFSLDLAGADILLVPNGSDHVAMERNAPVVRSFLDRGGALVCFDGWVTPWIPGHEWVMDNDFRTIDVRYRKRSDRWGVLDGVDIQALTFRRGISGWWACGYINAAPGADVVLEDSWGRAILVVDAATTPGLMMLTASGPVGPWSGSEEEDPSSLAIGRLYANMMGLAAARAVAHGRN